MAKPKRYLVWLLFFCVAPLAFAQGTTTTSFTFSVFAYPEAPADLLYWERPGVSTELDFKPYERSQKYRYQGPRKVDFFRQIVTPQPGGPQFERVSAVTIPDGIRAPLIMFLPSRNATGGYETRVLDDSVAGFPRGAVTVINYSGYDLRGLAAGNEIDLPQYAHKLIRSREAFDLQLALEHKGRMIPSLDERISLDRTQRLVVLLMPPPRKSSPLVQWVLLSEDIKIPEEE